MLTQSEIEQGIQCLERATSFAANNFLFGTRFTISKTMEAFSRKRIFQQHQQRHTNPNQRLMVGYAENKKKTKNRKATFSLGHL